jgi:hypothetical protein
LAMSSSVRCSLGRTSCEAGQEVAEGRGRHTLQEGLNGVKIKSAAVVDQL